MAAGGCCHVVGGAGFAPAVAELTRTAAEAGTHVGIAKGKDGAGFIDALGNHKLEVAVLVLGNAQIGHRAKVGVELGQVAAAGLAVEHRNDLQGGLLLGNVSMSK